MGVMASLVVLFNRVSAQVDGRRWFDLQLLRRELRYLRLPREWAASAQAWCTFAVWLFGCSSHVCMVGVVFRRRTTSKTSPTLRTRPLAAFLTSCRTCPYPHPPASYGPFSPCIVFFFCFFCACALVIVACVACFFELHVSSNPPPPSPATCTRFYRYGGDPADPSWSAAFPQNLYVRYAYDGDITSAANFWPHLKLYWENVAAQVCALFSCAWVRHSPPWHSSL
jgi:hypothetical protein